jgi:hypothetical protein
MGHGEAAGTRDSPSLASCADYSMLPSRTNREVVDNMTADDSRLSREQLLAAEIFGYSFDNYRDHLGNVRYDQLMPDSVATLARASHEGWPADKVAAALTTDEENARDLLEAYHQAVAVIDAENPVEGFRHAIRFVRDAVAQGLSTEDAIERLVTQVCFRTADLGHLLDREGKSLSRYSRHLRREADVEYYEGYFEEDDA